jgi:cytochrome c oxidase subunit IV
MSYVHYDPINDPSIHGDHPGALPHLHFKVEKGVIPPPNTKKIWTVFWIMLTITIIELIVGFKAEDWHLGAMFLKVFFIGLTIAKAYFIVYSFMHLGDENKALRYTIIWPFVMLILYLVFICLVEGAYSKEHKHDMDATLKKSAHAKHSGQASESADHSVEHKEAH